MSETIDVQVPFVGFYNSFYSDMIDREEEQFVDYQAEELDLTDEQRSELADLLWRSSSYETMCLALAKGYVHIFNYLFEEWTGVDLGLSFIEMQSPREYNFTTDRLFAKADLAAIRELYRIKNGS